ncbi:MAG: hypothetical protein EOP37_04480 [Rubrivivax sp.]|nr:MAG: hypothetical protein EOP37_04480 [Rubrivivax sp.]
MTVLEEPAAERQPLFGFGSILLAGFIGGPPAAGLLAFLNVQEATARARQLTLGYFVAATAVWYWCLMQVPPDAISQFLIHVPAWLVLSWPASLLLRPFHRAHRVGRDKFKSVWTAVGIAILVRIALAALELAIATSAGSLGA